MSWRVLLTVASAFVLTITSFPEPAAALKWEGAGGARGLCAARGPECKSFGVGCDNNNQNCSSIVACVDNRSTGNGVQCVQCKTGKDCTVLREGNTGKWNAIRGVNVNGVMTNSSSRRTGPSTKEISITKAIDRVSTSLNVRQASGSKGPIGVSAPPPAGILGDGPAAPAATSGPARAGSIRKDIAVPVSPGGPAMQAR